MTTSKFTYDVQHGTFCEDTSKSRLMGKEHSEHEETDKNTQAESMENKGDREERRESSEPKADE